MRCYISTMNMYKQKLKNTVPYTITARKITQVGKNLTKDIHDPKTENSKMLITKSKNT